MWGTGTEHCEQDPDFDVEVQILPNRILIIAKKVQIQQYPHFANMSRFNRIRNFANMSKTSENSRKSRFNNRIRICHSAWHFKNFDAECRLAKLGLKSGKGVGPNE